MSSRKRTRPYASRSRGRLDALGDDVQESGGVMHTDVVDALDPASVREHADRVAADAGRIDIGFNLIGHSDVRGIAMIEMDVEDFVDSIVRSTFLTAQATARHMVRRGEGVILIFGGEGEPMRDYFLGGTLVAFHAQETMRRQLATELAGSGVRVVTIITGGIPETLGDADDPAIAQGIVDATLIGRAATYEDVANAAFFAASDKARMVRAATLNITGGAVID